MDIVHRVHLCSGRFTPRSAQAGEAVFHPFQHEARLLFEASGREVAARDNVPRKFSTIRPLAAAGDDEVRDGVLDGNGVAEGVEAGLRRWRELRRNI